MPNSPTSPVFFFPFFFNVDESVVKIKKKKKTKDESIVGDVDREEKCQRRERLKERGGIKEGKEEEGVG